MRKMRHAALSRRPSNDRPMTTPDASSRDEALRIDALRRYAVLDTQPEQVLDDLTTLAATICEAPMALITLVDEDRQWFKSRFGLEITETPLDVSICLHAIQQPDLFIVPDATQDARFAKSPLVTGEPGIRFYAGAPLVTPDGLALGTLCVIDRVPRVLTPAQEEALRVLGRQVMAQLELRRQTRELAESEDLFSKAFRLSPDGMTIVRATDQTIVEANDAMCALWGRAPGEVVGKPMEMYSRWLSTAERLDFMETLERTGECLGREATLQSADLPPKRVNMSARRITLDGAPCVLSVMRDVSAERLTEAALAASELRYRRLFESAKDGILILDAETGMVVDVNPFLIALLGFSHEQFLEKSIWELGFFKDVAANEEKFAELRKKEYARYESLPLETIGGRRIDVEFVSNVYLVNGGKVIQCNVRDITERKKAEEKLRHSRALLNTASRVGRLGAWELDLRAATLSWSEEVRAIHETPPDYVPTVKEAIDFYAPEFRETIREAVSACVRDGTPFDVELQIITAKGRRLWTRAIGEAARDAAGAITCVQGAVQDISRRKEREQELARINRALKMSTACNEALTRAEHEVELLEKVCRIAVEIGGYRMAWVGYPADDQAQSIRPRAHAGVEEGYLSEIEITWNENEPRGQGPAGQTIRTGEVVVCEDLAQDSKFAHWLAPAQRRGYRGVICLPLRDAKRAFGLLGLYSAEINRTSAGEVKLLKELADNLAFGILHLRARVEQRRLQTAVLKVAASVSATIGTPFFQQLARNMAEAFGAQAGFVAQFLPGEPLTARTLAAVVEGKVVDNFDYRVKGTPCENLLQSETCVIAMGVAKQLPNIPGLAALALQGYAGRRLDSSTGRHLGQISVVFREPLTDVEFITSTFQIFAARAASELERQQTDAQMLEQAALLDIAHDAIHVEDLAGRIIYWNKGAERIYGWSATEAMGRISVEMLHSDSASFKEARTALLAKGEWRGETIKQTKDGREIAVDVRWTLVRDAQGGPKAVLAIDTDITERKKLEQQFLRAQRMESIGLLAGGIAHDLNNVLSPIILSIEVLATKFIDKDSQELLAIISSSALRGADMVRHILSFARGFEGERMVVQVRNLIREIEKIANDTFLKNIKVLTVVPRDLWTVVGDPTQIHQVLLNLCVNARDAMPGGGNLTITAENIQVDAQYAGLNLYAHAGLYVCLKIKDSGAGISAQVIEKIFDPFFTTKDVGKGTGLGLSTSLNIVKSHSGFIRVNSKIGKGTTFEVYFPAQSEDSADAKTEIAAELPRGNGELILVVDDETPVRQITQKTLENFGYRVALAADGADALAIYVTSSAEIAAVLTDMTMPTINGADSIRALRQINPAVRIIAVSGLSANANVARDAAAGVKRFLLKPYTTETLLKALKELLTAGE